MKLKVMMAALLLCGSAHAACNPVQVNNVSAQLARGEATGLGAFTQSAACYYWPNYYQTAKLMFDEGHKDEALQWLYAGEIRARVGAGLDPDASRNNALMVALNQGLATPLKAYAKRDKENWTQQIDAALAWDKAHPLTAQAKLVTGDASVAIDPENFDNVYAMVRAGLREMRSQIHGMDGSELRQSPGHIDLKR